MLIRIVSSMVKWGNSEFMNRPDALLNGDAITDLRTQGNALSVWRVKDDLSDINDVIAASAVSRDRLDKVCYLTIEESDLSSLELEMSKVKGDVQGVVDDILVKHRDILDIDYWRIGYLTQYLMDRANSSDESKRRAVAAKDVKSIVKDYVNRSLIDVCKVNNRIKSELEKL